MTDKEIMIDGVDVSRCKYVCNTAFGNVGCKLPFNKEIHCCNNPDCYYKQLSRKTQECEALKSESFTADSLITEQEKEIEELKERLERAEEDLKYQCVDCMNVKSDRYHKALKEIEEVCLEDTYTFADGTQIRYDTLDDILDIINKAKELK